MKKILYKFQSGESLLDVSIPYSEGNLAIAQREAVDGKYTVEDDGKEATPKAQDDAEAMLIDHEYRLTLLELGVTE